MNRLLWLVSGACLAWGTASAAQTTLSMWYHGSRNKSEAQVLNQVIADFNASQTEWTVDLQDFPQAGYNDSVEAGALAGDLPDILDVDGPLMPSWAWLGYLQPLHIDPDKVAGFLPGTKGYLGGTLYSIGLWDAAVSLVTRQSYLDALKLRRPTLEEPWSKTEFQAALEAAKASGKFAYALDLGMAWRGEWYPYAFSPFLQSFGGDLVDRKTYDTAEGALNGKAALAFGTWWQGLFKGGYAQAEQKPSERDEGFASGKYAFSWNGNWAAFAALKAFPDTVFLPAPDLGGGPKIAGGSWQFAVSRGSEHPEGAAAFIAFALQDKYVREFSNATGLVPATRTAAEMTANYRQGGPLAMFYDMAEAQALARPVTAGYPAEALIFERVLTDIANGAAVAPALDVAVSEIDRDIALHGGYGH